MSLLGVPETLAQNFKGIFQGEKAFDTPNPND
jgi:hypothetical protein